MASSEFFRLGSVTAKRTLLVALRHNKRTHQAERGASENIDATRTHLNYSLTEICTPEAIDRHAKVEIAKAGIDKIRTNAVVAVEIIFSLPINRHYQDTKPFFTDCYEWTKQNFAAELLSFDIHLDESAPHAHALILPLIDNKLQGDKLKGDRNNIMRLSNLFHTEIGSQYGLIKTVKSRLSAKVKQSITQLVMEKLKGDAVMKSSVYACIRDLIYKDPMPFAQLLSIGLIPETNKSFVDIKRSHGKGSFVK